MRALFGEGAHPNRDAMLASGATKADTRLGAAYPHYAPTDEGSCRSPRRAAAHPPPEVWLSIGLQSVGHRDEAWLERGLPSS